MSYEVRLTAGARREFLALSARAQERIAVVVSRLEADPRLPGARKLVQREGWRMRVGDHRMLYTIDDDARVVTVFAIGHRREVYRG